MMSKKQLFCMLTLHIIYLLLGASIFYHIESPLEMAQRTDDKLERLEIQNLLYENYIPTDPEKQDSILRKLSDYCGKSMFNYTTEDEDPPFKWDFYHSFFFSYTVVSTIGYGNLAPTTSLSRILMIFYGLFGIPINGILLANLGEYFGKQLITVYRKYKHGHEKRADKLDYLFHSFGMFGQIVLYLVPGFLFFIFLPACLFVVFEGWDYVLAVYYAFVTLTTIGFGDYVAGTINNGFGVYFEFYKLFLIVWITFGLGYIVMLLGFITSGMRSEGIHKLEQKLASQIKSTQSRILNGFSKDVGYLRRIINEAYLMKFKPVYCDELPRLYRSSSCPSFTFDSEPRDPVIKRKRANSENINLSARDMLRIQSDTDLLGIDRERTFTAAAIVKPAELLARVVNALGGIEETQPNEKGLHMFSDDDILHSESPQGWKIGREMIYSDSPQSRRARALSVAVPNYRKESAPRVDYDPAWANGDSPEKYFEAVKAIRAGKLSLPTPGTPPIEERTDPEISQPQSFIAKLNPFRKSSVAEDNPADYLKNTSRGRLSMIPSSSDAYKEKTKRGRHSIFPTFDFSEDIEPEANVYKEKTKRGRHSIFPTFDFSEDDSKDRELYKEKTKRGRHSIFPTFDFSEDDKGEAYKEKTKRGRHSIFPTFDFSEHKSDDEDNAESELERDIKKYRKLTKKGRGSLFPSFGRDKSGNDDETPTDMEEDIKNYQNKTKRGRLSLFPSFGKDRKVSEEATTSQELPPDVQKYQNQTKRGRNSLFAGDIKNYRNDTEGGRKSLFGSELDDYKKKTRRGRPSLFESDVNISELPEPEQAEMLEQTSVADLLRALALLQTDSPNSQRRPSNAQPLGLLDLIAPDLMGSIPGSNPPGTRRRGSLRPDFVLPPIPQRQVEPEDALSGARRRRISVRTAGQSFTPSLATVTAGAELQTTAASARQQRMNMLSSPPPPYSETNEQEEAPPRVRRYSPAPGGPAAMRGPRGVTGPVPRLFSRLRKESVTSVEEESSRRGSLTDVVVEENKNNT